MWDSAKKPIKVRSVLQPNGLRHFIVNEEAHEDIYDIKSLLHNHPNQQQRRNNNKTSNTTARPSAYNNEGEPGSSSSGGNNDNGVLTEDYNNKERINRDNDSWTLPRSITLNDASPTTEENGGEFFGVSGSKIYNSKKHKGQHSRYLHQFPHSIKTNIEISTRYPAAHLDLLPVKSPVIKKLINGRIDSGNPNLLKNQKGGQGTSTSTTLCSRIMTWIDLEVKRNSSSSSGGNKGKSSSGGNGSTTSLPYCSADLSIINELYEYQSKLDAFSSSPSSSSDRSSSSSTSSSSCGDGASSSCSSSISSSVSLPKLIPCWRKEGSNIVGAGVVGGNKTKKSVRIAEDLPRWGKMKRRLRSRTQSLNELYDEDEQPFSLKSPLSSNHSIYNNNNDRSRNSSSNKTDYYGGNSSKLGGKSRKEYSSVSDLMAERSSNLPRTQGVSILDLDFSRCNNESPEKETDSFTVCDERLLASGKVQVHIFLPQTDSAGNRSGGGDGKNLAGNLSARSEDSTS